MASFGWSAGDIISAINLVNRIRQSISGSHDAREHFQELDSELQALSRALEEISQLTKNQGHIPEIAALKFAACLCGDTLQRFYEKVKPFEESLGKASRVSKVKASPRMVRWELLIRKDVPELRSYLVAHVGSLQLRMSTALLKLASRSQTNVQKYEEKLDASLLSIEQECTLQIELLKKVAEISSGSTIPKIDSLLAIVEGVWKSQNEILLMLAQVAKRQPPLDLTHTYAQEPVNFEDALGRRFIVPSEYDWDKLEAIIQAQFKKGPGQRKARSGEYELFDRNTGLPVFGSAFSSLIPGASIVMTFIIGTYKTEAETHCARIGCGSLRVAKVKGDALACMECQSFFRNSYKPLPRPMNPILGDKISSLALSQNFVDASWDRRTYKNISVYLVELPKTPTVFREKFHRNYRSDEAIQKPQDGTRREKNMLFYRIAKFPDHVTRAIRPIQDRKHQMRRKADESVEATAETLSYTQSAAHVALSHRFQIPSYSKSSVDTSTHRSRPQRDEIYSSTTFQIICEDIFRREEGGEGRKNADLMQVVDSNDDCVNM